MYMELTPQDTIRDLQNLLVDALPGFEFPRKNLMNYEILVEEIASDATTGEDFVVTANEEGSVLVDRSTFAAELTNEEVNIIAILMMIAWVQRQVTSIENIRMKYSGSDFKFTSQANHLSKLMSLLENCKKESHHLQRLYKRRRTDEDGNYVSNWSSLGVSRFDH